jgi:hypothetical protein
LSSELDLPGFLRVSGQRSSDRYRLVRDHVLRMHALAREWLKTGLSPGVLTSEFADLIFAFGLARLGEATGALKLLHESLATLRGRDVVSTWLSHAFEYRIRQALDGKAGQGSLPGELHETLERLDQIPRYKVDRLREHSRILEPHEKIEPYRHWQGRYAEELDRELDSLFDLRDRAELAGRLARLIEGGRSGDKAAVGEARILETALELSPRLGEAFARGLLPRVARAIDKLDDLRLQATVLEKGLSIAAHFGQDVYIQGFVAHFHKLLDTRKGAAAIQELESLLGQSFRGLRKLGMREEIGRLLDRMAALVLDLKPADAAKPLVLQGERRGPKAGEWSRTLKLLLHVASGWFYFGQDSRAKPILDEARAVLFEGELTSREQTELACGYVRTLGQGPAELALARLEELFLNLGRVHDSYTTNSHYSLSRLDFLEAVVFSLVSDDFTLDQAGRRWLDDDEFLVRRRIHRDVRAALGQPG